MARVSCGRKPKGGSELDHRKREIQAAVFGTIANRALSRKTTGLDRIAKALIAKQLGPAPIDPELDHSDEGDHSER